MASPDEEPVTSRRSRLSEQRRRRLTRTLVVAAVLVLGVVGATYALTRDGDDPGPTASTPTTSTIIATTPSTTTTTTPVTPTNTTPASPTTTATPKPTRTFAPVNTTSVPKPTRTFGLEDSVPGTTNMQPNAAAAWSKLVKAAAADDVTLSLKVGWRSAEWQRVLQRQGRSDPQDERAGEWSLDPADSPHVKGYAVDVTTRAAATWVAQEGAAYGWCRPYTQEWWHLEYLATSKCPAVTSSIGD